MGEAPEPAEYYDRRAQLAESMPGFDGLIDAVQGLLVGWSIATGEIWHTKDVGATIEFAHDRVHELRRMTDAWGVEK